MNFKELLPTEQERYIISCFQTAVRVSKSFPSGKPRFKTGIYANISLNYEYPPEFVKESYTLEDYTITEKVICEWYRAFLNKDGISPIWKQLWIIFDIDKSVRKKCYILGIGRTVLFNIRKEGIEKIRRFLNATL